MPVESISHVLAAESVAPKALVLGGGEILGATWGSAAASLLPIPLDLGLLVTRRVSPSIFNLMGKQILSGAWESPYIPDVSRLVGSRLVANAIGASSLRDLGPRERRSVVHGLSRAAYLSVRDGAGKEALARGGIEAVLAPDSVAILARLYRPRVVEGAPPRLVVQASRAWLRGHGGALVRGIVDAAHAFESVVLLPMGLAGGHGDLHGLTRLKRGLERSGLKSVTIERPENVWHIAEQIAGASVFIGTSLHGAITSMAYATPFVPLCGISKLDAYLETWADDVGGVAVDPESAGEAIQSALRVATDARESLARSLEAASWDNTERVLNVAHGG